MAIPNDQQFNATLNIRVGHTLDNQLVFVHYKQDKYFFFFLMKETLSLILVPDCINYLEVAVIGNLLHK